MKKILIGGAALLAMGLAVSAYATSSIIFDTNGAAAGGQISVNTFDWLPDNALAKGAVPLSSDPNNQTQFTVYAQGKLGSFLNAANNPILGTGLNSTFQITYQMGFSEQGYNVNIPGFSSIAAFSDPAVKPVNFFNIYYSTVLNADPLTGTGYNSGINILSGVEMSNNTTFTVPLAAPGGLPYFANLDNFGANNYAGIGTVVGSGGGSVTIDATSQDSNYFISNVVSLIIDQFFNTSDITPFSQVNPSASVVGQTPTFGIGIAGAPLDPSYGGPGTANFTAVNGFGFAGQRPSDFLFQADANSSFQTVVPEPGTMILLGSGLLGLAGLTRRKMK